MQPSAECYRRQMRGSITSSTTGPFELCVHTHVCFHKVQFHQIDPLQCVSCGVRAFLRFSVQQQNDNKKKKLFLHSLPLPFPRPSRGSRFSPINSKSDKLVVFPNGVSPESNIKVVTKKGNDRKLKKPLIVRDKCRYHEKCIQSSMENLHTDVIV